MATRWQGQILEIPMLIEDPPMRLDSSKDLLRDIIR
jgi:hypothetical protein